MKCGGATGTDDDPVQVTIDYVMMTTGARYGNKIDSTKAGPPRAVTPWGSPKTEAVLAGSRQ